MTQDQFRCEECGEMFESQAELETHDRTKHSRYTCEVCGAILTSERELEDHNLHVHPEGEGTRR